MNAQPDLIRIPLDQLQLSPRNARKTGGAGVEDLAASIAAHGLLQNLTVQPSANEGEAFGVVAGGRRLAALQLLHARGELPAALGDGIPCRLIHDDDVALEASTAENTLREAMHPADQFDAFHAMVETGKPIADVAAHFGVSELVVRQRLKLANVNPQLVQIYRDNGMTLEQLQALALTDNHEAQRQAWFSAQHSWEREPRELRERITRREVEADSVLAQFVGLDAYEAAGGPVRRDLFATRGNSAWLQDKALLDKLALDKLEALAQAERDAGWSWAEAHLNLDYAQLAEHAVHPGANPFPITAEQQARLDEIEVRLEQLRMDSDEDLTEEECEAEIDRLEREGDEIAINAEVNAPAELKAATGVLVFLRGRGLCIERGRLKPGQKADKAGVVTGSPKTASGTKADAKPKKPEYSAAVLHNLSAHRSEAIRDQVMGDPQLALALLVDWLIARHRHDFADGDVLCISGTSVGDASKLAPDISPAVLSRIEEDLRDLAVAPKKDRLTWLIRQPQTDLLRLLAIGVGTRFDGLTERADGHPVVAALHAATAVDMADHWNAGCDNFLGRIPAPLVIEAVAEAKGKDVAATLAGLKKDALVAEAAKLLAGTGWLPKPLRGPGYGEKRAEPKRVVAKPAAKTPSTKAKPSKPAKKAPTKKAAKAKKAAAKKKARA